MTPDANEIIRIDRIQSQIGPASGQATPTDGATFRRLLESLEKLADEATKPAAENAMEFADAVAKADKDFATAMDFRRQLEEAYRRELS